MKGGVASAATSSSCNSTSKRFLDGLRFILCTPGMGMVQRRLLEGKIVEAGGEVVQSLDEGTHYVMTTDAWGVTVEWLSKNCRCSRDDSGTIRWYGATLHAMAWLYDANRRKSVMSRDYKRISDPLQQPLIGAAAAAAAAPSMPPVPLPTPPGLVVRDAKVSSGGRITPPCYCDLPCLVKSASSARNQNAGREFFICAKDRTGDPCRFFEWADEPARPENYAHFERLNYAFERLDKIQLEEAKQKRERERERQSHRQRQDSASEVAQKPDRKRIKLESQALSSTQRELQYVDEGNVFEELKCAICVSPFIEPRTATCGHTFCQLCIFKFIEASSRGASEGAKCPSCRAYMTVESLRDPDQSLLAFLGDLHVHCSCKSEGCEWTGKRSELGHHEAECAFVVALSVHNGTSTPVQYADNGLVIVNDKERIEINAPSRLGPAVAGEASAPPPPGADDAGEPDSLDMCDSSDETQKMRRDTDVKQTYSMFTPPSSDEDMDASQFEFNTAGSRAYIDPRTAATTLRPYITSRRASWAVGKAAAKNELENRQINNINQALVDELKKLADRYENLGEKWRARGHRLAAGTIMRTEFLITSVDQVRGMPNIGEKILAKIGQFLAYGEFAKNRNPDPELLAKAEMGKVYGVGASHVEKLWVQGVRSLDQMRARLDLLNRQQLIGLRYVEEFQLRIPRDEVDGFKKIIDQVAFAIDPELILEICGSYRRGKSTCGDIDVLVTHRRFDKPLTGVLDRLVGGLTQRGILTDALTPESVDDKWMGVGQLRPELPHRRIDFQLIARPSWACALLYFTGSALFNRSMRHYAGRHGFSLSQHALVVRNTEKHEKDMHKKGVPVQCMTEEDVFTALGLDYVEPHKRDL